MFSQLSCEKIKKCLDTERNSTDLLVQSRWLMSKMTSWQDHRFPHVFVIELMVLNRFNTERLRTTSTIVLNEIEIFCFLLA